MSRRLADLEDDAAILCGDWLRLCAAKGIPVLVYETYRSPARQLELFKKGRELKPGGDASKKSHWRRVEGAQVVTRAFPGESRHQVRRAWDAVPWSFHVAGFKVRHKLDWTPFGTKADEREFRRTGELLLLDDDWKRLVELAEGLGIKWAGRWSRFVEYVHWEAPF